MNEPSAPSRAAISGPAILAELGVGLLCGVAVAALLLIGGGLLIAALIPNVGMALLAIMLYLGMLGFAIGAPLGVALAGRWQRQGGSWWLGLGGSLLGGVSIMALAVTGILGSFTDLALWLTVVAALALAVVGYNLKR